MGTVVTLTVVHSDADAARAMIRAAFAEMERLETIFSRHRSDSDVGRLNAAGVLHRAPPELLAVLAQAEEVSLASNGGFDVTVLPLLRLYERSFSERGTAPSPSEVADARGLVDHAAIRIAGEDVRLDRKGMGITLDGVAKGYIVDRTVAVMASAGADRVLVNAGGDMASAGEGSAAEPWTIGVQDPDSERDVLQFVRLGGECIATSGDYMQAFTEDRTYHHIIDPRTGYSPVETSAVSVVAESAAKADALSTALLVLGPGEGQALLEATPSAEGLIVTKSGRRVRSSGMRSALTLGVALFAAVGASLGMPQRAAAQTEGAGLFDRVAPLSLAIEADFTALRGDRRASPKRPALLTATDADGRVSTVAAEVRTRGNFRLDPANCSFPPLRIDIELEAGRGTVWDGQERLKLVSACRPGRGAYEELVMKEYLAYRSFQVLTDESFRVRLVELSLVEAGTEPVVPRFGFLIEDDDVLAARLGATVFDLPDGKNLPSEAFDPIPQLTTAVFQYMIGNTDWSDVAGHNVEILERRGAAVAVPYDFDMTGLVDPPYATTNPDFQLRSVQERYFRGWCTNPVNVRRVLESVVASRDAVLSLWQEADGLSEDTRRKAIAYLQSFFDEVSAAGDGSPRFLRDCRVQGGADDSTSERQ
jgi:thiamine biosynthesis lipoprotein